MVYLATKDCSKLKPIHIKFDLKQANYTADIPTYLFEKFPKHEFF